MNTRKKNEERADLQSRRLEDELVEDMDWKDDPAIEIARNARKAEARAKQKHYLNNEMVRCLMIEMVEATPAESAVGKVLEEMMDEATIAGATEMIWKELQGGEEMMAKIKHKMNDRDNTNRMEKQAKDRNTRMVRRDLKSKK